MSDPYVYPGTNVLRNKLGIQDESQLDLYERRLASQRSRQGAPKGGFDLAHLRAIHRHLFQDIYDWAGEVRTVEISKGGHQFQLRAYIDTGMADVHRRLTAARFLRGLEPSAFAEQAGRIMGDVNYVHPFREGNGRTQLTYLDQLARQAWRKLDLTRFDPAGWLDSSRRAHGGDYAGMTGQIARALQVGD